MGSTQGVKDSSRPATRNTPAIVSRLPDFNADSTRRHFRGGRDGGRGRCRSVRVLLASPDSLLEAPTARAHRDDCRLWRVAQALIGTALVADAQAEVFVRCSKRHTDRHCTAKHFDVLLEVLVKLGLSLRNIHLAQGGADPVDGDRYALAIEVIFRCDLDAQFDRLGIQHAGLAAERLVRVKKVAIGGASATHGNATAKGSRHRARRLRRPSRWRHCSTPQLNRRPAGGGGRVAARCLPPDRWRPAWPGTRAPAHP